MSKYGYNDIDTLIDDYLKLNWFQKLFIPRELERLLKSVTLRHTDVGAKEIYLACIKHTWGFQRWVLRCLNVFFNAPITRAIRANPALLAGKEAQANFEIIAKHKDPNRVADALRIIQSEGLLTREGARHQNRKHLVNAVILLRDTSLLTETRVQENFDAIAKHKFLWALPPVLQFLQEVGLLTGERAQENFDAIARNESQWLSGLQNVLQILQFLQEVGLLTREWAQKNFDAIARNKWPEGLNNVLQFLQEIGLLTGKRAQKNFDAIAKHKFLWALPPVLQFLQELGLLTGEWAQKNFDVIAKRQTLSNLPSVLRLLQEVGLLTGEWAQKNFDVIAKRQTLSNLPSVLRLLQDAGLLSGGRAQENFDAIAQNQDPNHLHAPLSCLWDAGLLTGDRAQENFDAIAQNQDLNHLHAPLLCLRDAGLLSGDRGQENFQAFIENTAIFCVPQVWDRIPEWDLTSERWAEMLDLARRFQIDTNSGRTAFVNYVERVFLELPGRPVQAAGGPVVINHAQSTHNASIHQSISESAARLDKRYKTHVSETIKENIDQFLSQVEPNKTITQLQVNAANRCFLRIRNSIFMDPSSTVLTKDLLALVWLAINDEEHRTGSKDDACNQFIEGLYEIQRGYNIDEKGIDDGLPDRSICTAGTFNKLIEKLAGIHGDVEIRLITPEVVSLKLPIVTKKIAIDYLNELAEPKRDHLLSLSGDAFVKEIWRAIKELVFRTMKQEYDSLFMENKKIFDDLIENGEYALDEDELRACVEDNSPPPSVVALQTQGFFSGSRDSSPNPFRSEPGIYATQLR